MNNVMIDNETMGTVPNAVILSIGAVKFDKNKPGELGGTFYAVLDKEDQIKRGRIVDPETVRWWSGQSPEAQEVLHTTDREPVRVALERLWLFLGGDFDDDLNPQKGHIKLWGNGSDFDNPQIVSLFNMYGLTVPWEFWNNRCFRTMKSEFGSLAKAPKRTGTYHNALDDAITQVEHLHLIQTQINIKLWGKK